MSEELESIAIVGMAGRFPGAKNVDEFWQNIRDGVESIEFFNDEELLDSGIEPEELQKPNYIKAGATLGDIDLFDAAFFGFSPREAEMTDPQHRLFLECAWEALENAGYNSETYPGRIGAFAGVGWNSYLFNNLYANREFIEAVGGHQTLMGNDKDFLTTRISYKLNLRGPSINVQTACSTSLVATSLACSSLLSYQCDMALAGGVSIFVPHKAGYLYREGGFLSPDGHCRAFDAKAQGTVIGNGVGIVVLKRLSDAIADGDCIHAVIKSATINNDGALKVGYTAPSVEGQTRAIAEAIALAGINPETISYIETHGTATPLGDPVEIAALTEAFSLYTNKTEFCAIGSVKTNIGHLDAAAGVAGLIKTVLALKNKQIPATLHFEKPNPEIDFDSSPFYVNTTLSEWKSNGVPRRAGVSSFGVGGTNAHVILEESPLEKPGRRVAGSQGKNYQLLVLSAKTNSALETATINLVDYLKQHQDLNLADVAYTLQVGRRAFNHRRTVVCRDIEDAIVALQDPKRVFTSIQETNSRPVAFMFPGLGTQYVNMARELYQVEPTFRKIFDRCCELFQPHLGLDLRDVLYSSENKLDKSSGFDLRKMLGRGEEKTDAATEKLNQTFLTQPAIFAVEYALAQLLIAWGIHPQATIGYSIGEYVAACLAEVFSLEEAITLVAKRAKTIQELPGGAMLAVPLSEQEVQPFLNDKLSLSAINGASLCVIAGAIDAIEELEQLLIDKGLACRRIVTSHAFHSYMMEAIAPSLRELVKTFNLKLPKIPYLSNVTGTWITAAEATNPDYWVKHLCQPVRFADGIQELWKKQHPILLEVGPGQTLCSLALQCIEGDKIALSSLRHSYDRQSDIAFLLNALGQLWLAGVQIDWSAVHGNENCHRLPLPTYPFERQRYWISAQKQTRLVPSLQPCFEEKNLSPSQEEGRIDRQAPRKSYVAPTNEIEERIAQLFQQLLGVEQVGINDNFFALGGHSLLGIQLISQLRKDFQIDLSLRPLFEAPTVAELALFIEEILLDELEKLPEEEVEVLVSVSQSQAPKFSSQRRYKLPNNLEIVYQTKAEADYFYEDIFQNRVYLKHGINLRDRAIIFDVGANIGMFTLFASQNCNNPTIYCFEPAPPLFEILRLNTTFYEINAKLFNFAISNEPKTATFTFYPNSSGMSSFYADKQEEKEVLKAIMLNQLENGMAGMEQVMEHADELLEERFKAQPFTCQLRTISEIISENNVERIDLLKIDVQKSELDVLQGIKENDWQKIQQIVIEVHDIEGRLQQVTNLLKNQGYRVEAEQEDLYEGSNIHNVYAIRNSGA
ncbi:FkbM family methyltransferase [Planktothrix sp. FACHB-1355]|uniref:Phenolphthiocerol/phthiocerol polyketide synthase subunit E n=1 Tax=Aerosakkonema funiforme FACHB-1375 TaxID=2949571 RepID=A0A926VGJ5_9CYAN|nr:MULTISPECIES: type I polyketide synthase [Oscillatoriales]MBD2183505.1 FkbM family methyltransferase [Aerosakkonema funiforme FACHB-1375]MBD3557948.1 FkbM family methyltransferase [Planktothrix sp. FACHB-1355]